MDFRNCFCGLFHSKILPEIQVVSEEFLLIYYSYCPAFPSSI